MNRSQPHLSKRRRKATKDIVERDVLLTTLKQFGGNDNVIVVPRAFVRFTGSLEAGMMLSQLLYWSERDSGRGRIYKSDAEWMVELSLSRRAVRDARARLEEMGIVRTEVHRANGAPTTHYYIEPQELERQWGQWIVSNGTMDCPKPNNGLSQMGQSLTEITTENTTKITTEIGETKIVSPTPPDHPIVTEHKERIKDAVKTYLEREDCQTAVDIWRAERGKNPPKEAYPDILNTVGSDPADLQFWREVLHEYALLGWNRQSVSGALDWFRRREIPHVERKNGNVNKMNLIQEGVYGQSAHDSADIIDVTPGLPHAGTDGSNGVRSYSGLVRRFG